MLRESPSPSLAILPRIAVSIFLLLKEGNLRRKTESTDANAASSRSHAVLTARVTKRQRLGFEKQTLEAKLTLVDLAGSEHASDTRNCGQQLKESANINT